MAAEIPQEDEQALGWLRASLLQRRPEAWPTTTDDGFQQLKLLATAIHRTTELDRRKEESQTDAWVRYFTSYFPEGRNDAADARLLFKEWRTALLKGDAPGPGVAPTHGQSQLHWQRNEAGQLAVNLEDLWDDFEHSVGQFIEYLRVNPERRQVVLQRWSDSDLIVQPFASTTTKATGTTFTTTITVHPPDRVPDET